jgi:glutathione S-transferase
MEATAMTIRLFDVALSGNCYKVRMLLARLEIAHERVPVNLFGGETRTAAFLAKNPHGKVPVLELEDGQILTESNAILFFLARGSAYWPANDLDRARVMQWLCFEQYSLMPNLGSARLELTLRKRPLDELERALLAQRQARGRAALEVIDGHLAARPFFVGDGCSIADISLYAYTHLAGEAGLDLAPYPAITTWLERVRAQPGHVTLDAAA